MYFFLSVIIGATVEILCCEDWNGQSEIIAECLLATKDESSMKWMMENFKNSNSNWINIHVVWQIRTLANVHF